MRFPSRLSDQITLLIAGSIVFGASSIALASVEIAEEPFVIREEVETRAVAEEHHRALIESVNLRLEGFEIELLMNQLETSDKKVDPLDEFRGRTESLNAIELRTLLELVGFEGDGLHSSWAVAMKESTGKPDAHNTDRTTGDNSYGLFQINMIGRLGPARREAYGLESNEELFDPVVNAQIAYDMSNEGTDFGPWGIGPNAYEGGKPRSYPYWLTQFPEEG